MTKKQREIAKKSLCEWVCKAAADDLYRVDNPSVLEKGVKFVFAVTVENREFAVFRFTRGVCITERCVMGVAGGFSSENDEDCAAFSGFYQFPKKYKAAEKLARKLAEHTLKG